VGGKNQVICGIAGAAFGDDYVLDPSKLPPKCDSFVVGLYAFDRDDGHNKYVMEADKGNYKQLPY